MHANWPKVLRFKDIVILLSNNDALILLQIRESYFKFNVKYFFYMNLLLILQRCDEIEIEAVILCALGGRASRPK